MRIGFSLGLCVRDIYDEKISLDDAAFVITSTAIRDRENLRYLVDEYLTEPEYLQGRDFDRCLEITERLWDTNRLLQPRRQGLHWHLQPKDSAWVDIFPTNLSDNDAVKRAWDNYRVMIHMTENVDNESVDGFKV